MEHIYAALMWLNSLANPTALGADSPATHRPSSGDPRVVYVGGRPRRASTDRGPGTTASEATDRGVLQQSRSDRTRAGVLQQSVQLTSVAEQAELDEQPCCCDENGVVLVSCCCLIVFGLVVAHHLTGAKLFVSVTTVWPTVSDDYYVGGI